MALRHQGPSRLAPSSPTMKSSLPWGSGDSEAGELSLAFQRRFTVCAGGDHMEVHVRTRAGQGGRETQALGDF